MSKLIRIICSPFHPPLEVAEDLVIQLHVPYSADSVTVMVNPNLQHYQEKADADFVKVRQLIVTTPSEQTKFLSFDFGSRRKQSFNMEGHNYEIELMGIDKTNIQNQDFLYFEFNVTKT